jgi:hypothetical protein
MSVTATTATTADLGRPHANLDPCTSTATHNQCGIAFTPCLLRHLRRGQVPQTRRRYTPASPGYCTELDHDRDGVACEKNQKQK